MNDRQRGSMMTDFLRRRAGAAYRGLVAVASLLACSCGSNIVGGGVAPSYLLVYPSTNTTETTSSTIYPCQTQQLHAQLVFTDGSSADYTTRVNWSSSSPGTVAVSNDDIEITGGGGATFARGMLIPGASGFADITADYQGMTRTFRVIVGSPPVNLRFLAQFDSSYIPLDDPRLRNYDSANATLWLASATNEPLRVFGDVDGVPKDFTGYAGKWEFDGGGDPGVATLNNVDAPGIVYAVGPGATQTLRASFLSCSSTVALTIGVANPVGLTIEPEFVPTTTDPCSNYSPSYTGPDLFVGNTELFRVRADIGLGDPSNCHNDLRPDVSRFVVITSSNPDAITFSESSGILNLGSAVASGTTTLTATGPLFPGYSDQNPLTSAPYTVSAIGGTLQSITVGAPVQAIPAGSADPVQFSALGTIVRDGSSNLEYQPVTRQVTWSVTDPSLLTISNSLSTAGQAVSTGASGVATVAAHSSTATVQPDATTLLTIQ
jgi:hypothetical protein